MKFLRGIWGWVKSLRKDWYARLGAILVACILAMYVQFAQNVKKVMHIRVNPPAPPPGLVFSSRIPSFMEVELYGNEDLMDFTPADFKLQLANPKPVRGDNAYRVKLLPEVPDGIETAYPRELRIQLDEILFRELPVDPVFEQGNDTLGGISVRPRSVVVRGPAGLVGQLDRLPTSPIPAASTGKVRVPLADLPDYLLLADGQSGEVEVQRWPKTGEGSLIEGVAVKCGNAIPGLKLRTPPQIRVRVPGNARPEEFRATVFCPVYLDPQTRSIRPAFLIERVLVEVEDLTGRERIVVQDGPVLDSLQFEKVENLIPIPVQQGREEHIFR